MKISPNDKIIIQELAKQVAEIASSPVQDEKRRLWKDLNGLKPRRPMVMIDQICWHELNFDGFLDLLCENKECRSYENQLRQLLFQWKHFPVDMVVEPFIAVPKAINNSGYGLGIQEDVLIKDPENDVISHKYINVMQNDEDIDHTAVEHVFQRHRNCCTKFPTVLIRLEPEHGKCKIMYLA